MRKERPEKRETFLTEKERKVEMNVREGKK